MYYINNIETLSPAAIPRKKEIAPFAIAAIVGGAMAAKNWLAPGLKFGAKPYAQSAGNLIDDINSRSTKTEYNRSKQLMDLQNQYNVDMFGREADFSREMYGRQQEDALRQWQREVALEQSQFERNQAAALEQWNRENAYNSAAQQKKRFLAAGMNPSLMMAGQGSVGSANFSAASPAVPSGGQTPLPNTPSGQGVGLPSAPSGGASDAIGMFNGMFNSIFGGLKLSKELANLEADTYLKGKQAYHEWRAGNKAYSEAVYTDTKNSIDNKNFDLIRDLLTKQSGVYSAQAALMEQQARSEVQNTLIQTFNAGMQALRFVKYPDILSAELGVAQTQILLNKANASQAYSNAFKSYQEGTGVKLNNTQQRLIMKSLGIDSDTGEYVSPTAEHMNGFLNGLGHFFGKVGGAGNLLLPFLMR